MRNRFCLSSLVVCCASSFVFAEAPDESSSDMLRVLDAFVGNWRVRLEEDDRRYTDSRVAWSLGGRFLEDRYKTHTGEEGLILRTYDKAAKEFRVWTFNASGSAYQTGQWNEKTRTLVVKGKQGENTLITKATFKDNDTIEWTVGEMSPEGKVLQAFGGVNTRMSPSAGEGEPSK